MGKGLNFIFIAAGLIFVSLVIIGLDSDLFFENHKSKINSDLNEELTGSIVKLDKVTNLTMNNSKKLTTESQSTQRFRQSIPPAGLYSFFSVYSASSVREKM